MERRSVVDIAIDDVETRGRRPPTVLAETLAPLIADDEIALVAGAPSGDRWVRLGDALGDDATLAAWLSATAVGAEGSTKVAMMFLASWLTGTIVDPLVTSLVRQDRAWTMTLEALHVRPTDEGWFDGLAIEGGSVLVLDGDPAAGRPGTRTLPSRTAMRDEVAVAVVPVLEAALRALQGVGSIGAPAFWGSVADTIASAAVIDAAGHGGEATVAFADGAALTEAVAGHARMSRVRPTLVSVPWSGGLAHEVRRGTCCLWYRTQAAPDPWGEGYCSSCPRRDPEDQRRRWAGWLEEASVAEDAAATGG